MTITEMREKRNKLVGMMDTFLDTHTTDKGTLSAEDDKTYKLSLIHIFGVSSDSNSPDWLSRQTIPLYLARASLFLKQRTEPISASIPAA